MKLKICLVVICLLLLYLLIPIGDYDINDVGNNFIDNRSAAFSPIKLSFDSFVSAAKTINNPEVGYLVHPSTAISRDGDNSVVGILYLTSGYTRTGSHQTGNIHNALDTDVGGHSNLGSCPAHVGLDCDDTVLISPINGVVEQVVNNKGFEDVRYKTTNADNSIISIKATGIFEGRSVRIIHLANIPDYIQVGYEIKQGEYIGTQCAQGNSTGSHAHFEVRMGQAKVHVQEWFTSLTTHSSIGSIVDLTGSNPSRSLQGWTSQDVTTFSNNPKYDYPIIIPDEYIVR